MSLKKIKDPIYGYVEIEDALIHDIIDTATFQRLRNIRQTSYAPLYPASLHNRFVHSIGVYYLGKIALDAVKKSLIYHESKGTKMLGDLNSLFGEEWDRYKALFELACLLHDVGHSPFSHTGEEFYRTSKSRTTIVPNEAETTEQSQINEGTAEDTGSYGPVEKYNYRNHLCRLTKDDVFLTAAGEIPAPHEIMSCIVAIEAFGSSSTYFQNDSERSFFARCITGRKYDDASHLNQETFHKMDTTQYNEVKKKMLLNCLVQLLNSDVIDVDRLDYIIRDASTMGYQSVSLDYERLLKGIVIVREDDYNFTVGFHKNAISIIENTVYAHDNEKKWIQSHPTILYESFLLQQSIVAIEEGIKADYPGAESTLFSYDSLTSRGSQFGNMQVRYLGDADLIHFMKNVYSNVYSEEYFSRDTRRLPVWKSEAEFRNLFQESERTLINKAMNLMMAGDSQNSSSVEVNDTTLCNIDLEIAQASASDRLNLVEASRVKKKCFEALLNVCDLHRTKREVVLLSTNFFKSGFSKGEVQKLNILFPDGGAPCRLQDVSPPLSSATTGGERLIFLFYYPGTGRARVDVQKFTSDLVAAFKRCSTW